ncbi:DivIVA domain-containing protein [Streptomyces alkaliphilus]|uniref:DivIVA domain-containing protein n=1 Tax=Streptomyces alkaliphilus TaxID=1472722 RepID=UPI00118081D0|nr:DivIVA domain-containing protein [Streptomyces alkaliphilus]MQS06435.1 DivIVA domain-containing protein [Streptomyces alkaliphilus]
MFWWLMAAMVVVVGGVTLAVLGSGDGSGGPVSGGLPDAEPDRPHDPLPTDRPVAPADVVAVRLPVAPRGYRMAEVDEVLDRLAAELAERDARIAELRAELRARPVGERAVAHAEAGGTAGPGDAPTGADGTAGEGRG